MTGLNFISGTDGLVTFTDLNPNTVYNLYARVKETDDVYGSEYAIIKIKQSESEDITTSKKPADSLPEFVEIEYVSHDSIKIKTEDGIVYHVVEKGKTPRVMLFSESASSLFTGLSPNTEYQIYILRPETETNYSSDMVLALLYFENDTKDSVRTLKAPANVSEWERNVVLTEIRDGQNNIIGVRLEVKEGMMYAVVPNGVEPALEDFSRDVVRDIATENYKVYVYKEETETEYASEIMEATFYQEAKMPEVVEIFYIDITDIKAQIDAQRTGTQYLYSLDGKNWITPSSNNNYVVEFTNLNPNSQYYVYLKVARSGEILESAAVIKGSFITEVDKQTRPILEDYISDNSKYGNADLYKDIIDAAVEDAKELNNREDIDAVIERAKEQIEERRVELIESKEDKKQELKDYLDYLLEGAEPTKELLDIIDRYTEEIKDEYDPKTVSELLEEAKRDIVDVILNNTKQNIAQELRDYAEMDIPEIERIINDTVSKITGDNLLDREQIVAEAKAEIDSIQNEIYQLREDAVNQLKEYRNKLLAGDETTQEIENIISNFEDEVNYKYYAEEIEELLNKAKEDVLSIVVEVSKERAEEELINYAEMLIPEIEAIIADAVSQINEDNVADRAEIIAAAKALIDSIVEREKDIQNKTDELLNKYYRLKNSGKYYEEQLKQLDDIINEFNNAINKDNLTPEQRLAIIKEASDKLDEVPQIKNRWIDLLMEEAGIPRTESEIIDYASQHPYETTESLIQQGLIKEKVKKEAYEDFVRHKCECIYKASLESQGNQSETTEQLLLESAATAPETTLNE